MKISTIKSIGFGIKWLKYGWKIFNFWELKRVIGFSLPITAQNRIYTIEHPGGVSFDYEERRRILNFLFPLGYITTDHKQQNTKLNRDNIYALGAGSNNYTAKYIMPNLHNIKFPTISKPFFSFNNKNFIDSNDIKHCLIYKRTNQVNTTTMSISAADNEGTTRGLEYLERYYCDIGKEHKNGDYAYFLTIKITTSPCEIIAEDITNLVFAKLKL